MDLKFTFGAAGQSPSDTASSGGIPLPFAGSVPSTSSILRMVVTGGPGSVSATALSGDGVSYAASTVEPHEASPEGTARAARSAIARAGAELSEPLRQSVIELAFELDADADTESVLSALGLPPTGAQVDAALQTRTGLPAGTPVSVRA